MEILILIMMFLVVLIPTILFVIILRREDKNINKMYSFFNYQIDTIVKAIKSKDAMDFADSKIEPSKPETIREFQSLDSIDPEELINAIKNEHNENND